MQVTVELKFSKKRKIKVVHIILLKSTVPFECKTPKSIKILFWLNNYLFIYIIYYK